jgi:hypothetical protein
MWQKLGGYSLGNSDDEVIGILRWPPLLAESVYRKTANHRVAQFAAAIASPFLRTPRALRSHAQEAQLLPLHSPEEAASVCAEYQSDKITNRRDAAFLKWRYFSPVTPTASLFAFRSAADEKKVMVAVQLQNRGYKQQIRALQILDIWGEPDSNSFLAIATALAREYREHIDMLVFRCVDPADRQSLATHGFKARSFAAPIAWCIDKRELLPSKSWYFVPADGDMFL